MVDLMCHLDWAKGRELTGKRSLWGAGESVSGGDQHPIRDTE